MRLQAGWWLWLTASDTLGDTELSFDSVFGVGTTVIGNDFGCDALGHCTRTSRPTALPKIRLDPVGATVYPIIGLFHSA